jgi:hypothetical protein
VAHREPQHDLPCAATVHRSSSGFCQCGAQRTSLVTCSHPAFSCMQKCKRLSNWATVAPAASTGGGGGGRRAKHKGLASAILRGRAREEAMEVVLRSKSGES